MSIRKNTYQIQRDETVYRATKDYEEFRHKAYENLDATERVKVNRAAVVLRDMLKERSRSAELSLDNAVEIVMTSLYFKRFGETPIETRVKAYGNKA